MADDPGVRLAILGRSGTAPICEDCGYRLVPIDACRDACRRCGVIVGNDVRSARYVALVFNGRVTTEVWGDDDRP